MKTFRYGVSSWKFVFEDCDEVNIREAQEQKVIYFCDKLPRIEIQNAAIDNKLIEKITNGIKISRVIESYTEHSIYGESLSGSECYTKESVYNCTLENIEIVCKKDECSIFNIALNVNYYED